MECPMNLVIQIPLAREVNKNKLNGLYHELYEEYWSNNL